MDLKRVLVEMGDTLINDYGFSRSKLEGKNHFSNSTDPVLQFLIWLDSTPEAKQVLADMGHLPPQHAARPKVPLKIAQ